MAANAAAAAASNAAVQGGGGNLQGGQPPPVVAAAGVPRAAAEVPVAIPGAGVNNINLLRTIESFYGLPKSGKQTPLALAAGLTDGPIKGIFTFDD